MIVAGLLLVATVAWTYFGGDNGPAASAIQPGGPRAASATGEGLPAAEGVRLSSLEQPRQEPSEATRNPFRFGRRGGADAVPDSTPIFQPTPTEPPAPSGPPQVPPIPLKFIGVLEKGGGDTWAVLSVGDGRAPLHGKEGDIIDGRYRIVSIGTESIEMVYVDGRGRQTLRLTGQ